MTEERLTIILLEYLATNGWEVLAFDFPQSGTGITLRSNQDEFLNHKTKGRINPDIIVVKDRVCLFFENKDRYYYQDFIKQNNLIKYDYYKESIIEFLQEYKDHSVYYGIGLPLISNITQAKEHEYLVDFIVTVTDSKDIEFIYNPYDIQITS